MATTLTPFRSQSGLLNDFRREMDSLVNQFFTDEGRGDVASWMPRINLAESENQYEVTLDLPGIKPEDINIEVRQGDLWITGERKSETEEKGKTFHRIERYEGQFRRVIRLGDVDPEKITAEYTDGVLNVSIPKREEAQSKRISVKAKT